MLRTIGIVLLVVGLAGLAVGTVQYTRTKQVLEVGPIDVEAKEKERFRIPPLAAGAVAVAGLALVLARRRK
jgi:uncharacterized membrane protein YidH (DUF202 family)